ncbi:MAG: ParB/RepB/Spo0J family partition protein [Candidatus Nitrosocaldus sp.]
MLVDLNVDELKNVDHVVTLSTYPMVRSIADTLKKNHDASSIQPIVVGEVGGEYYILDGYARVQACRIANVKNIRAYVIKLKSKQDAQIWHIRLNVRSTLNILKLYEAIKSDIDDEDYLWRRYGMDQTMTRLLRRLERIKGKAYTKICMYMNSILTRFNRVPPIPYYIIVLISELEDEELQEKAVDFAFINIDDNEDVFSFQDYDRMLTFIKMLRSSYRRSCNRYIGSKDIDNRAVSTEVNSNSNRNGNRAGKERHILHFRCTCGISYSIDTKSKTVNRIDESENLIVLRNLECKKLYIVPEEVIESLELNEYEPRWYIVNVSEINSLMQSLKRSKVAILMRDG